MLFELWRTLNRVPWLHHLSLFSSWSLTRCSQPCTPNQTVRRCFPTNLHDGHGSRRDGFEEYPSPASLSSSSLRASCYGVLWLAFRKQKLLLSIWISRHWRELDWHINATANYLMTTRIFFHETFCASNWDKGLLLNADEEVLEFTSKSC
jgi:hypothetical protein